MGRRTHPGHTGQHKGFRQMALVVTKNDVNRFYKTERTGNTCPNGGEEVLVKVEASNLIGQPQRPAMEFLISKGSKLWAVSGTRVMLWGVTTSPNGGSTLKAQRVDVPPVPRSKLLRDLLANIIDAIDEELLNKAQEAGEREEFTIYTSHPEEHGPEEEAFATSREAAIAIIEDWMGRALEDHEKARMSARAPGGSRIYALTNDQIEAEVEAEFEAQEESGEVEQACINELDAFNLNEAEEPMEDEAEELREMLNAALLKIKELDQWNLEKINQLNELRDEIEGRRTDGLKLLEERRELRAENQALQEHAREAVEVKRDAIERLNEVESENDDLRTDVKVLEAELKELKAQPAPTGESPEAAALAAVTQWHMENGTPRQEASERFVETYARIQRACPKFESRGSEALRLAANNFLHLIRTSPNFKA